MQSGRKCAKLRGMVERPLTAVGVDYGSSNGIHGFAHVGRAASMRPPRRSHRERPTMRINLFHCRSNNTLARLTGTRFNGGEVQWGQGTFVAAPLLRPCSFRIRQVRLVTPPARALGGTVRLCFSGLARKRGCSSRGINSDGWQRAYANASPTFHIQRQIRCFSK